ncbi:MAG: AzlD domain-containing protein [Spiribacter salinus]|jgi:branched-subunit amino acid transport protein|uniref:AzlD domain-containing protein n=1 Tax=Spiribacter salinus TaxID=1335746 RepID=A0A540VUK5_9GAMM|nr:AzlD domain-containing protein [Spiribacter sp.]TQF00439.1 MAG: AzlD domain-containing protein [Spiribacter salinus]
MIDPLWWLILAIGAGTYLWRGSFIVFGGRLQLPDLIRRGLNYVPPAVFAALVLPGLVRLTETGQLDGPRLAAGAVAALVAWRTRGTIATLVAGMIVLWVLRALGAQLFG